MNILNLLIVSEPGRDGVFSIVDSIIRQIHSRHPEIRLDFAYSSQRAGEDLLTLVEEVKKNGGRTLDLRVGNKPCPRDLKALWQLNLLVRERCHHLVFAMSSKAGALARILGLLTRCAPVVYAPQSYYGMGGSPTIREKSYNAVEKALGLHCPTINCSEDERDYAVDVLRLDPKSLHLIHNGVDTDRFVPADGNKKAQARHQLKLPNREKILATVGRDSTQKNYRPLYEVLDELLPNEDWSFAHAGAGSTNLRSTLSPKSAARCQAYNHLIDPSVLLQAADGFVMTSLYEGLSLAMLEAMSCGLPVILSDAQGFRCLKSSDFDDVTWIANPGSPKNFKESLKVALVHWGKTPPGALSRQRDKVCKMFKQDHQIEKIITFCKKHSTLS